MLLDPHEKEAYKITIKALRELNAGLAQLRAANIACRLMEEGGKYFLDAKAIITTTHAMD